MKRAIIALAAATSAMIFSGTFPAIAAAGHLFPIDGPHRYGSPYGEDRGTYYHRGQDLPADQGTPLRAPTAGQVAYRAYQGDGAGHYLVIHGDDGRDSVFMHLETRAYVAPGERVRTGQLVGRVGSTGRSTGPHLHFERWTAHWYDGGHDYNPLSALLTWDRPAAPKDLVADRASAAVALDWAPVRESDLAGYRVYRRTVDGSYERIASTRSSSYTDSTASASRKYYYRVKAVDGTSNVSGYSNFATAESVTSSTDAAYVQTVDNSYARFSASSNWGSSRYSANRYGDDYRHARPAAVNDPARFRFRVPRTGDYSVQVWHPSRSTYSSAAPIGVRTTSGMKWVNLDQRANGGRWRPIGRFRLAAGDEAKVFVSRWSSAPGAVIADAVRIVEP